MLSAVSPTTQVFETLAPYDDLFSGSELSVYCLSHIFGNALSSCELPVSLACELCFLKYHLRVCLRGACRGPRNACLVNFAFSNITSVFPSHTCPLYLPSLLLSSSDLLFMDTHTPG